MLQKRSLHMAMAVCRGRYPFFNKHRQVTDPAMQEKDFFVRAAQALAIDEHYVDNLAKIYTDKIGAARELNVKAEDRLVAHDGQSWLPRIDPDSPRMAFRAVDQLVTAPESVRKMFSIGYGERSDVTDAWKAAVVSQVKQHALDSQSLESRIAWLTALIRHWTLLIEDIGKRTTTKPKWVTHPLFMTLNYRRKLLRQLRETDSASFDKVLKELKIAYRVPRPPGNEREEFTRKGWAELQARHRVDAEKEKRLAQLHQEYVREREEQSTAMDDEERRLQSEQERLEYRLRELDEAQGRAVLGMCGRYEPRLVDCLSETTMHDALFYHPRPVAVRSAL